MDCKLDVGGPVNFDVNNSVASSLLKNKNIQQLNT